LKFPHLRLILFFDFEADFDFFLGDFAIRLTVTQVDPSVESPHRDDSGGLLEWVKSFNHFSGHMPLIVPFFFDRSAVPFGGASTKPLKLISPLCFAKAFAAFSLRDATPLRFSSPALPESALATPSETLRMP
jgi:hypothetical protein